MVIKHSNNYNTTQCWVTRRHYPSDQIHYDNNNLHIQYSSFSSLIISLILLCVHNINNHLHKHSYLQLSCFSCFFFKFCLWYYHVSFTIFYMDNHLHHVNDCCNYYKHVPICNHVVMTKVHNSSKLANCCTFLFYNQCWCQ